MKKLFTLLLSIFPFTLISQTCEPNGISTNPTNPTNPTAPSTAYINNFNWFQQAVNGVLFDMPLNNMSGYYPISAMLNPYNPSNLLCNYLEEADLDNLDVYPEDGWELLFFNLGTFPNGSSYASANNNVPYIMLYNKYRSTLRIFGNAKFLQTNYEEVRITLKFDEEFDYSGLFRINSGTDRTLDQATTTAFASSITRLPNADNAWFHVDFQVAYDPCTCLYDSRLLLEITPITSTQIEITNSDFPDINIDLQNNNGLDQASAIIPVAPRMITFHTMAENIEYARVVSEKYLARMATDGFNTDVLASTYSTLALLEVLAHAQTNTIGGSDIAAAAQHAADMRIQWGLLTSGQVSSYLNDFTSRVESSWGVLPSASWSYYPGTYSYTLNLEQVVAFCQLHMPAAQSFASYALTTSENENKFSITPSSAYGSSTVELQTAPPGNTETVNLLNPGTYPIQETDANFLGVNAQNYPVYNEVLGLFAVLEQPKLDIYHEVEINEDDVYTNPYGNIGSECGSGTIAGPYTVERYTYSETIDRYKFKLTEPLKILFNPTLSSEIESIELSVALHLTGFYVDHEVPSYQQIYDLNGASIQLNPVCFGDSADIGVFFWVNPELNEFHNSIQADNLKASEDYRYTYYISGGMVNSFSYTSGNFPIDVFNEAVFTLESKSTQKWKDFPRERAAIDMPDDDPNTADCWWQAPNWEDYEPGYFCGVYPNAMLDGKIDDLHTDLMREISFYPPGSINVPNNYGYLALNIKLKIDERFVIQAVKIPIEGIQNNIESDIPVSWSYTQNPNSIGSNSLTPSAYYNVQNWTANDINTTGGEYLNPPSSNPIIMPSHLHSIDILGNQTKDANVSEVIFKAEDHISVYGDVTLPEGFTLRIEDLVNETSIPTPSVSETELSAFCQGIGGNSYSANQRSNQGNSSFTATPRPLEKENNYSLGVFPNPTTETLNLSLLNFSGQVQFEIYNAIGNKLQSFSKSLDNGIRMNYVTYSAADLPNGTYTIIARMADGTSATEQFVVLK